MRVARIFNLLERIAASKTFHTMCFAHCLAGLYRAFGFHWSYAIAAIVCWVGLTSDTAKVKP